MHKEVIFRIKITDEDLAKNGGSVSLDIANHFPTSLSIKAAETAYTFEEQTYDIGANDFNISWGDGIFTSSADALVHEYKVSGEYDIIISAKKDLLFQSSTTENDAGYNLQIYTTEVKVPSGAESPFIAVKNAFSRFERLTTVANNIFFNCKDIKSYSNVFNFCTNLKSVSKYIFSKSPEVIEFCFAFRGCESLGTIPEQLFRKNKKARNFKYLFYKAGSNSEKPIVVPGSLFNYLELSDGDTINTFNMFAGGGIWAVKPGQQVEHFNAGVKVESGLLEKISAHMDCQWKTGTGKDVYSPQVFAGNCNVEHIHFGDTCTLSDYLYFASNHKSAKPSKLLSVRLPNEFTADTSVTINFTNMFKDNPNLHTLRFCNLNSERRYEFTDMLDGCTNLRHLYNFDLSGYNPTSGANWNGLTNSTSTDTTNLLDQAKLDTESVERIVNSINIDAWSSYTGSLLNNFIIGVSAEAYNDINNIGLANLTEKLGATTLFGKDCTRWRVQGGNFIVWLVCNPD